MLKQIEKALTSPPVAGELFKTARLSVGEWWDARCRVAGCQTSTALEQLQSWARLHGFSSIYDAETDTITFSNSAENKLSGYALSDGQTLMVQLAKLRRDLDHRNAQAAHYARVTDTLEAKLRESEASASVMRDWIQNRSQALYPTTYPASRALSKDAGRELLAEVERLRRKVAAAEGMAVALEDAQAFLQFALGNSFKPVMQIRIENALTAWQEANK